METTALLASLAIVSACVALLGWVIKAMFGELKPMIATSIELTKLNTLATEANTKASEKTARAVHSLDTYTRERNGRANHFYGNIMKSLLVIQKGAKNQIVEEQTVEHQVVNNQS